MFHYWPLGWQSAEMGGDCGKVKTHQSPSASCQMVDSSVARAFHFCKRTWKSEFNVKCADFKITATSEAWWLTSVIPVRR
jgi:hypothetical protein